MKWYNEFENDEEEEKSVSTSVEDHTTSSELEISRTDKVTLDDVSLSEQKSSNEES